MKKLLIFICLIFISVNLYAQYTGDGMGDHKAKKNLNMNSHSIIDVDLVDGNDISEIAKSTGDINAVVLSSFGVNDADHNAMRAYTNATRGNVAFITTNTATGYYGYFGSSNSVGLPPTGGGGGGVLESSITIPANQFITNGLGNGALPIQIIEQETYRGITSSKTYLSDICFTNGQNGRADYEYYIPQSGKLKMYTVNHATGVAVGSWLQEVWVATGTISMTSAVQYLVSESTVASNNQYDVIQPHDITLTGFPVKMPIIISVIVRGTATGTPKQDLYFKALQVTE